MPTCSLYLADEFTYALALRWAFVKHLMSQRNRYDLCVCVYMRSVYLRVSFLAAVGWRIASGKYLADAITRGKTTKVHRERKCSERHISAIAFHHRCVYRLHSMLTCCHRAHDRRAFPASRNTSVQFKLPGAHLCNSSFKRLYVSNDFASRGSA